MNAKSIHSIQLVCLQKQQTTKMTTLERMKSQHASQDTRKHQRQTYKLTSNKGAIIGQFTRLLRSLELRAVSHRTVLLLWDQKLLFRMRDCFEGSKIHLPTL